MKRFLAIAIVALTFTACHYGKDEAQKTLERNDLYKGDKAEYSVNRAGGNEVEEAPAADSTATVAPADTAAKVAAPAHAEPAHH